MKAIRFLVMAFAVVAASCGTVQNRYQVADDDVYFSKRNNSSKPVIIPDVDVDKVMREHPSRVDTTRPTNYLEESTPNKNAAAGYPAYRAHQDSLYDKHPELSSYYNDQQRPPFDLKEEKKRQKAYARQQRRLARANRSYYSPYNNNYYTPAYYGYNDPFYNGWNNYSPGWNYGMSWNNWYGPGFGFGYNSFSPGWGYGMGWNNFYNPWYGFSNPYFYNPYYPYYYYGNAGSERSADPNPPVSRPREMTGSSIPPSNGMQGSPQMNRPGNNQSVPADKDQPQMARPAAPSGNDGRATLRNENGNLRYIPPANYEPQIMKQSYPNVERSNPQAEPVRPGNNDNIIRQRDNIYEGQNPNINSRPAREDNVTTPSRPAPEISRPSQDFGRPTINRPAPSPSPSPRGGGGGGSGPVSRPR